MKITKYCSANISNNVMTDRQKVQSTDYVYGASRSNTDVYKEELVVHSGDKQ